MTQSGQGEEPSARPAREGIVLPSDGGEPLLPGMTGGQGGRPTSVPATPPAPPPSAPPGGQAWGTPWGPDQNQNPNQNQNPPSPSVAPGQAWGTQQPGQSWAGQDQQYQPQPQSPQQAQAPAPWNGAQGVPPSTPAYGQGTPAGSPMPAPQPSYGQGGPSAPPLPPAQQGAAPGSGMPLPPAPAAHGAPHAPLPHPGAGAGAGGFGAPLPPADEGATQYIPPVSAAPAGADDQATRYIPPVGASPASPAPPAPPAPAADEGATQYLPPVGPGPLPPEAPAESTQILGRARRRGGAAPQGGAGPMPPASGRDAEATQYLPPVTGQPGGGPQRQPLSDFDSLFRSEPGGEPPAAATQQMPSFQQPPPQRPGPHEAGYFPPGPPGGYGPGDGGRGGRGGGRKSSKVPLLAGVGVGIVALGIGAGALLAGGSGDEQKTDNRPVSATAPATEGNSPSPSADPAERQAIALDKLLADSGDSRTAVINAVADVKSCDNLAQAAKDLRDAAKQRDQLVTDLSKLAVDRLPDHSALTSALNKAWKASASADNHYAAWADQVAAKKGQLCKKGQARTTGQTQAGNRASGTASAQKKTAAQLWNTIAEKYGLTQRQPTQL
ncbi:hypothetical protein ABZ078_09820 [Streptomyces sp. NPDC006385]|uniref:hypothetical protein n=1 Tax=Streptomyces sp. NPDC006385 TaxID=3156761 RepID=UPI0033A914CD